MLVNENVQYFHGGDSENVQYFHGWHLEWK